MGCILNLVSKVLSKSFLVCWLNSFRALYDILIGWWFMYLSVQTFQTLIVIYRRDNFVYLHRGCTLICRPLSYHFWSPIIGHKLPVEVLEQAWTGWLATGSGSTFLKILIPGRFLSFEEILETFVTGTSLVLFLLGVGLN